MDSTSLEKTTNVLRWMLAAQLLLGGQARLTSLLTPGAHQIAMSKAPEMARYMPIPFVSRPEQHTKVMGAVMLFSAGMLCVRHANVRLAGAVVAGATLGSWVYASWKMGAEWYVPVVNCVITGLVVYQELG